MVLHRLGAFGRGEGKRMRGWQQTRLGRGRFPRRGEKKERGRFWPVLKNIGAGRRERGDEFLMARAGDGGNVIPSRWWKGKEVACAASPKSCKKKKENVAPSSAGEQEMMACSKTCTKKKERNCRATARQSDKFPQKREAGFPKSKVLDEGEDNIPLSINKRWEKISYLHHGRVRRLWLNALEKEKRDPEWGKKRGKFNLPHVSGEEG